MIAVNLIPPGIQWAQARRRHVRAWTTAGLIAAVLTCIPLLLNQVETARAESMMDRGEAVRQELSQLRASLRQLASEVQDASLHLERARALRSKRAWSSLLATIGGALPERCWLTSMATDPAFPAPGIRTIDAKVRGSQPGAAPASANAEQKVVLIDGPRALRISGYASDASDPLAFVTHLKETGLFRTVHLESFRSEPTPGVPATRGTARVVNAIFRFDVLCEW